MRKGNLLYYGSMADSPHCHAPDSGRPRRSTGSRQSRVAIQLQLPGPQRRAGTVVKKGEKAGLYTALDFGSVWLERALAGK